jgi:ferredoxin-NADP reductase
MAIPGASSGTLATSELRPISWRQATLLETIAETPRARTLVFEVPGWPGHRAGQHVDVRLTAEDGYQAQRSYSIASAPEDPQIKLTIERLDDGEVSPYLTDELRVGDRIELRGPIGGYFVWEVALGGPLLLVGGGSGIAPLMAMLRHRANAAGSTGGRLPGPIPTRVLYSSRSWNEVIYRAELARLVEEDTTLQVSYTLTREQPAGWAGFRRRIDRRMLEEVAWPAAQGPHVFVCGPTLLVEAVATALVSLGYDPTRVKTERFGPTG